MSPSVSPIGGPLLDTMLTGLLPTLGRVLLHFVWQGALLAALAVGLMALCHTASARYAIGLALLVLMLVAPLITLVVVWVPAVELVPSLPVGSQIAPQPDPVNLAPLRRLVGSATVGARPGFLHGLAYIWLVGVGVLSLRTAGGFLLLERMHRQHAVAVDARMRSLCRTLQDRLGVVRVVRFCQSTTLEAPAVIGWFRPVVLLPVRALTGLSDQQLLQLVAHELAHVKRLDAFANVLQIAVETLLFYHPAVWWLSRRVRAEREYCCDEIAIASCGTPADYARTLVLLEGWRDAPALAMAANRGSLQQRVERVLGIPRSAVPRRSVTAVSSALCLLIALGVGRALFGLGPLDVPGGAGVPADPIASGFGTEEPGAVESDVVNFGNGPFGDLSSDDRAAFAVHGVTPEFVQAVRLEGFSPESDGFVAMRVHGITPEYIREVRTAGLTLRHYSEVVALKVQGVEPAFVRELGNLGLEVNVDKVVALKVHGVTPAYVEAMRQQGLPATADEVLGLRVHRITPESVAALRVQGIDPEVDEMIAMKVQGVTPEYVTGLLASGFAPKIDQIVGAKVQGISLDFVAQAREFGFEDLDLGQLIQLKQLGVLPTAPREPDR